MLSEWLPHNWLKQRVDTASNPLTSFMLIGIGMGLTLLLYAGAVILFFIVYEKFSGGVGGAGGIIGFLVLPIVGIVGAPWSFVAISLGGTSLFVAGIIAGPLINGALIGAAYGFIHRHRSRKRSSK